MRLRAQGSNKGARFPLQGCVAIQRPNTPENLRLVPLCLPPCTVPSFPTRELPVTCSRVLRCSFPADRYPPTESLRVPNSNLHAPRVFLFLSLTALFPLVPSLLFLPLAPLSNHSPVSLPCQLLNLNHKLGYLRIPYPSIPQPTHHSALRSVVSGSPPADLNIVGCWLDPILEKSLFSVLCCSVSRKFALGFSVGPCEPLCPGMAVVPKGSFRGAYVVGAHTNATTGNMRHTTHSGHCTVVISRCAC